MTARLPSCPTYPISDIPYDAPSHFLLAMQLYSSVCMSENYKQGLPMKKFLILFTLLTAVCDLRADAGSPSQLISLGAEKPKVRLQLEINPLEIEHLGLKIQ